MTTPYLSTFDSNTWYTIKSFYGPYGLGNPDDGGPVYIDGEYTYLWQFYNNGSDSENTYILRPQDSQQPLRVDSEWFCLNRPKCYSDDTDDCQIQIPEIGQCDNTSISWQFQSWVASDESRGFAISNTVYGKDNYLMVDSDTNTVNMTAYLGNNTGDYQWYINSYSLINNPQWSTLPPGVGSMRTSSTTSSAPSPSSAVQTQVPHQSQESHSSISAGAIAGAVVGGVLGLAAIMGLAIYFSRRYLHRPAPGTQATNTGYRPANGEGQASVPEVSITHMSPAMKGV